MRAMCKEYPGITLISIAGFHDTAKRALPLVEWVGSPSIDANGVASVPHGLLAPFADGLIEGASPKATFVDGCESAYTYTLNKQFIDAQQRIKNAFDVSAVPELYKARMNVGFGLMLDYGYHSHKWHTDPKDFGRNHFTPVDFGNALYFAMLNSDKYVWVYSELDGARFLENVYGYWQDPALNVKSNVPDEYIQAIKGAQMRGGWTEDRTTKAGCRQVTVVKETRKDV